MAAAPFVPFACVPLVPLEIAIQKGVIIKTDTFTSPMLKYRRCDRNGCYVETPVENSFVFQLSHVVPLSAPARLGRRQ